MGLYKYTYIYIYIYIYMVFGFSVLGLIHMDFTGVWALGSRVWGLGMLQA